MLDNPLITLIINTIIAGEASANIAGTPIKQAFQPTQQGVNTVPTAYLYKINDTPYGSPLRTDIWNPDINTMVHTETQTYETTFQISALATQNPANQQQYTASDIINLIRYILQSSVTIATLLANDVGIERVTAVRNTPFEDDRQRHEFEPSFDFIVTHKQTITTTSPIVVSTEINISIV